MVTTLLTPYFIRVASLVSDGISTLAPHRLRAYFSYYTVWMARLRERATSDMVKGIKVELAKISVHVLIVAAILLAVEALPIYARGFWPFTGLHLTLAAILLSLPSIEVIGIALGA